MLVGVAVAVAVAVAALSSGIGLGFIFSQAFKPSSYASQTLRPNSSPPSSPSSTNSKISSFDPPSGSFSDPFPFPFAEELFVFSDLANSAVAVCGSGGRVVFVRSSFTTAHSE